MVAGWRRWPEGGVIDGDVRGLLRRRLAVCTEHEKLENKVWEIHLVMEKSGTGSGVEGEGRKLWLVVGVEIAVTTAFFSSRNPARLLQDRGSGLGRSCRGLLRIDLGRNRRRRGCLGRAAGGGGHGERNRTGDELFFSVLAGREREVLLLLGGAGCEGAV